MTPAPRSKGGGGGVPRGPKRTVPPTGEGTREPAGSAGSDESPGLPGCRTWRGVYLLVFVVFVLVVVALTIFSSAFA